MKPRILLLKLASLLLISLIATSPSQAKLSPNKAAKQKWFMAKSPNFTIIADSSEKKAVKLAQNLERFRAMYELLANANLNRLIRPVKVYATKREATYNFFRGDSKSLKNTSGFFTDSISGNYSAVKLSRGGKKYQLSILFHEYTHYLGSNLSSANSPYWYSEGFAEYLGETEFKDDNTILFGKPNIHHLNNIDQMHWMPLETLLNTSHIDSKNRKERYKIYSQGWLLVHYFESSPTRIKHKQQFLKLLSEGVKPYDAIEQSTNLSFSDFEKELKKHSRQRRHYFSHINLSSPLDVNDIQIKKLSPDEALYQLGEFALQARGDFTLSKPFFEKAIDINPQNADAFAGLANTYLGRDDAKVSELIDKAKSIEPENPWVATISGHLNGNKMKKAKNTEEKEKFWNQAARDYNTAINSGKINVEAITSAALLYSYNREYKKSLELFEIAYDLAPNNHSIRLNLIVQYLANKKKDLADIIATKVRLNHHLSDQRIDEFEKWYSELLDR